MFNKQLIEDCKQNNKRAQTQLYRQYNQAMYNVAMRFLRHHESAEDIIQDSFMDAFKSIHQFKAEVTFGAWLKKIVIHNCLSFLRKKQLELTPLNEAFKYNANEEVSDWNFDATVVLEDVKQALDKLKEKYRFVIMLYLIEGYDHVEISSILNITVTASKTQLMRGKIKLKQLLKHKGYGERY